MRKGVRWRRFVRELDAQPLARAMLGLAFAALVTVLGLGPRAVSMLPHPALPFRVMRLMAITIVVYLALTWLLGTLHFYYTAQRRVRLLARKHPFLARLPSSNDLLWRAFVKKLVRSLGPLEGLLLTGGVFLLLLGSSCQYAAMEILLQLDWPI
ncbi:MAG: hypothetical protein M5U26_02150 [Planctomycetota bacterium]|nr:hypothetical protein [Planctomycetota bacterium]